MLEPVASGRPMLQNREQNLSLIKLLKRFCNSREKTSHYEDFAMTGNLGRKYCQKPVTHVMKENLLLIFWHYLVSNQGLCNWKY